MGKSIPLALAIPQWFPKGFLVADSRRNLASEFVSRDASKCFDNPRTPLSLGIHGRGRNHGVWMGLPIYKAEVTREIGGRFYRLHP